LASVLAACLHRPTAPSSTDPPPPRPHRAFRFVQDASPDGEESAQARPCMCTNIAAYPRGNCALTGPFTAIAGRASRPQEGAPRPPVAASQPSQAGPSALARYPQGVDGVRRLQGRDRLPDRERKWPPSTQLTGRSQPEGRRSVLTAVRHAALFAIRLPAREPHICRRGRGR
jgi:hypothetical protein